MSNLTIYTLPTCGKCRVLKTKLNNAGIPYTECTDVPTMQELGLKNTPAIKTETNQLITDFGKINSYINTLIVRENRA